MQNFKLLTAQKKFHQIRTLISSFFWKYITFQLKKCRGVMSHDTKEWCKIWRKTDLMNLHLSTQNSQNFHFDWLLLCKVFNIWPKKVERCYLSWHWRVMQNLKEKWFAVWKMTWWMIWALQVLKIFTLTCSFCVKYLTFFLRKWIRVIFHDTEDWCKIWRKNGLRFAKII